MGGVRVAGGKLQAGIVLKARCVAMAAACVSWCVASMGMA